MTNEMELCTIIKNSLNDCGHICYRIPDPSGAFASTTARPFDLFGSFNTGAEFSPLYIEAKYLPTLKSFDLQLIEDHQINSLLNLKRAMPNSECWIVLGVKIPRANRVYIFKDIYEIDRRRKERRNFLKKELEGLPHEIIKKNQIKRFWNSQLVTNSIEGKTI